jgi:hypothetical protein
MIGAGLATIGLTGVEAGVGNVFGQVISSAACVSGLYVPLQHISSSPGIRGERCKAKNISMFIDFCR